MSTFWLRFCAFWVCVGLAVSWAGDRTSAQPPAPPPQVVPLQTKDGVQLAATYYSSLIPKGTPQAKQVTPVVLLHDYMETRAGLASLARRLQVPGENDPDRPSFAVVTVDLRAHGDSTQQILPNGEQVELDAARIDRQELITMATLDMEAVRGLLIVKNDAGELNLNKLCLVGMGMGASVAVNWAAQDWAAPALLVGKQGQDVKGLALVSPRWSYKGLGLRAPLRFNALKQNVAWMLVYGDEDARVKADINRISRQLDPFHQTAENAVAAQPQSMSVMALPSKLQGGRLYSAFSQPVENQLIQFLTMNVARNNQEWTTRADLLP